MIDAKNLIRLPADSPLPCRFCGRPAFRADEDDEFGRRGIHPCCFYWIGLPRDPVCTACWNFNSRSGEETRRRPKTPKPGGLRRQLDNVVVVERDVAKARILARLKKADGLWLDLSTLIEVAGAEVPALMLELQGSFPIESRPSPVEAGAIQYRIPT